MAEKKKDAAKAAKKAAKDMEGSVDLVLLCDESGSMGGNEEAVISGVNEFLDSFKGKDCRVTIGMFDKSGSEPMVRLRNKTTPIGKVKPLTAKDYTPRGTTPLNDAVIETITQVTNRSKSDRCFMVILTDGFENASEAGPEVVARLIKEREKEGWAFLYLGANHDAGQAASRIGIRRPGSAYAFTSSRVGTQSAMLAGTGQAQNYFATRDAAEFDASREVLAAATGGVILEDDPDVKDRMSGKKPAKPTK
jgi:uncharacterized protein YegL